MNTRVESVDRSAHPLFQAGGGGSNPTSTLQLTVEECNPHRCAELNKAWHSALPHLELPTVKGKAVCYWATHEGRVFAVAAWSDPVAPSQDDGTTVELRRFAIATDAPKNTGSRMLRIMASMVFKKFAAVQRLISYQANAIHEGTIYAAAGWTQENVSKHAEWGIRKRRKRAAGFVVAPSTRRPSQIQSDKVRWAKYRHNQTKKKEAP